MHNLSLVTLVSLATLFFFDSVSRAQPPSDKPSAQIIPKSSSPNQESTAESPTADSSSSDSLYYDPKSGQKFSYDFEIAIRGADETIFYKGTTQYTVVEATDQHIRLTYRGGLYESTKVHESRKSGAVLLGPRGLPHPHPMSVFGRMDMLGKTQTTNQITLSRKGQVLVLDGSSHLPFLLGNVSLIPFEAFPADDANEWSSDSGVSIAKNGEPSRVPFFPLWTLGTSNQESVQAASEVIRYQREKSDDQLMVIRKTYEMTTPNTGDRESFHMTGQGTWEFNNQQRIPQSSEMNYTLVVKDRNTTTTYPMELKFSLLTPERIAQLEVERKAAAERSAKIAEERKAQVENRKAEAEKPLNEQEKKDTLAALASDDYFKVHSTLVQLMQRQPKEPDPDIALAARKLLNSDRGLGMLAERLLLKHDPKFRVNHEYARSMPVPSTGLKVDSSTKLYVGQIIQVHEHRRWIAAEIAELLDSGDVAIIYRGWGNNRRGTFRRADIQLAPPEVDQPRLTATEISAFAPAAAATEHSQQVSTVSDAAPTVKSRSWSDVSGTFRVEATYLGKQGDQVLLRRNDGKEVAVPLARLSADDQHYVAKLLEEAQRLGNPFEPNSKP